MPTRTFTRLLLPLTCLVTLSGCLASNPLQIPDEQWVQLTREQQLSAYQQQAELDKARIEANARTRQARIEAEARKLESRAALRRHARYGDLVQCVIDPLKIRYGGKWRDGKAVAFDLIRGETRAIRIRDRKERYGATAWVRFEDNGQAIAICRNRPDATAPAGCAELLGTTREFHQGISNRLVVRRFLKAELRCDLKPVH